MLVYPVLVVALGAIWPLDWTPTRLYSVSPVTGHYHGSTWAMAEVIGGDDPEDVVVVEGTTSDEVGKNKESQKGWKGFYARLGTDGILVVVLIAIASVAAIVVASVGVTMKGQQDPGRTGLRGQETVDGTWWIVGPLLLFILFLIVYNRKMFIDSISCMGGSGNSLKKLNAKNVN